MEEITYLFSLSLRIATGSSPVGLETGASRGFVGIDTIGLFV